MAFHDKFRIHLFQLTRGFVTIQRISNVLKLTKEVSMDKCFYVKIITIPDYADDIFKFNTSTHASVTPQPFQANPSNITISK